LAKKSILDAGYWILDTGYWNGEIVGDWNIEYWILDS
jgi:hypothetical protein